MNELEIINSINVGIFFILSMTVLMLAHFLSFFVGRRFRNTSIPVPSEIIPNNILGLLALILGFSFSIVINRYEIKRELAIKEANAIETAYLRSKLIKYQRPEQIQELFLKYVNARINSYQYQSREEVLQKLTSLQTDIWINTKQITRENPGRLEAAYVYSLNEMFEIASERTFVLFKMLNIGFYLLILILAATAFGIISFDRGLKGHESYWRHVVFIVLFSIVFSFIFDMDHFRTGIIKIGQDPMLRVRGLMLLNRI